MPPAVAHALAAPAARALADRIKAHAYGLGFDLVGITPLGPAETSPAFERWLDAGRAGEMDYLERGRDARRDSRRPLPGATTAIVVAMNYGGLEPTGPVARYARGDDYHELMWARLRTLHAHVDAELGAPVAGRGYVDTGPLLERDLARRAGLGWFGKNTNLLNPALGSFFFLGALLVDAELAADAPFEADRCGSCTRCIEACPTNAITAPRELDATLCISYLTIELKGAIDEALRPLMGGLTYGCDICQEVCPWNLRFSRALPRACPEQQQGESPFAARDAVAGKDTRTLAHEWLTMTQVEFSTAFKGSAMKRAKRRGLARNAAVALGNPSLHSGQAEIAQDIALLERVVREHDEPLVREHAAWALERLRAARSH